MSGYVTVSPGAGHVGCVFCGGEQGRLSVDAKGSEGIVGVSRSGIGAYGVLGPNLGGFVCDVSDPLEWRREVAAVWQKYYVMLACGTVGVGDVRFDRGEDVNEGVERVVGCRVGCPSTDDVVVCAAVQRAAGGRGGDAVCAGDKCVRRLCGRADESVCESAAQGRVGAYVDVGCGSDAVGGGESVVQHLRASSESDERSWRDDTPVLGIGANVEVSTSADVGPSEFDARGNCMSCGRRHGRWYHHNKNKQQRRKFGVGAPFSRTDGGLISEQEKKAKETLALRRSAENVLAAEQAERKLRLMRLQDEDTLVKMQRAQVLRTTETCKVQVERAFRSLKKAGDVPVDGTGSAETVVSGDGVPSLSRSDGSGISPDSSVSQQEIRQMQKDLLDAAEEKKKYEEALGFLEHAVPEQYKQAMYRANCKKAYTLDSQGEPEIDTVGSIRDGKFYPEYLHEGYALNPRHRSARNEVPFPGEEDLW